MKNLIVISLLVVIGLLGLNLNAQHDNGLVRKGNKAYEKGKFTDAEVAYRKALEKNPTSYKGMYNLGDALYKQKNFEEAGKSFATVAQRPDVDKKTAANAWFNMGNTLLEAKKYNEAFEAFKNSLVLNPTDPDAKYNLEYARRRQQDQQKQDQQNKDQNKDQQKQDQQKQDQQKQDQQKQDQQKQDQQKQQQQQQQKQQNKEMSKQDAERMLEAMKNAEQKTRENLDKKRVGVIGVKSEKDW
jgi:tetratricopeptide (TPR) repeat protein